MNLQLLERGIMATLVKHINNKNIINHIVSWMEFTKQRMLLMWMKFNNMDHDNFNP